MITVNPLSHPKEGEVSVGGVLRIVQNIETAWDLNSVQKLSANHANQNPIENPLDEIPFENLGNDALMDDLLTDVLNGWSLTSNSVSIEFQDNLPEVETNPHGPEVEVTASSQRITSSIPVSGQFLDFHAEVVANLQGPEVEVSANPHSPDVSTFVLYQTEVIAEPEIPVKRGRGRPKKEIEQVHPRYFHLPIDKTDCGPIFLL